MDDGAASQILNKVYQERAWRGGIASWQQKLLDGKDQLKALQDIKRLTAGVLVSHGQHKLSNNVGVIMLCKFDAKQAKHVN